MNRSSSWQSHSPETNCLERKRRVLKVACRLFARHGFEGTHVREVCNLAGVNIALVCYRFRDKQGLYEAVRAEARKRLSRRSRRNLAGRRDLTPEGQLEAIIESLFARLSGDSAWIARLVARELAEETKTSQGTVSEGFRGDLTLLESVIRDAVGPETDANTIRLDALNVLSQCVFYCAAKGALTRFSPKLDQPALKPQRLVRHLTLFSLRGLGDGARLSRTRLKAPGMDTSVLLQNIPTEKPIAAGRGSCS
jgi:AcrR family transcriptional regulator